MLDYVAMATLISAILLILWFVGKSPVKHKAFAGQDLTTYIETLLKRGHNGGHMTIETRRKGEFLQISKYIEKPRIFGLQMDFPQADWSTQYYKNVQSLLHSYNVPFNLQKTELEEGQVREFISADLKRDMKVTNEVIGEILTDIFKLPIHHPVIITFSGVSPRDEMIDGA